MNTLRSVIRSRRLWGLLGTGVAMYFLIFVVLGRVNVGWLMPDTHQIARAIINVWPQMPFFTVSKQPAPDGHGEVVYYTVPTRQLTPQELAQMGVTNSTAHPTPPQK